MFKWLNLINYENKWSEGVNKTETFKVGALSKAQKEQSF